MFKMRVALLGAMALLVVSGFAASAASAAGPYWHVGGTRFEKGASGIKLQLKGVAKLAVPKAGVTVECNGSISEGSAINGNGTNQGQDKGKITYSSCKTTKSECKVAEPITTNLTKSYLAIAATQTKIVDVFEPEKGEVFVELKFSKGCGLLEGTNAVKGDAVAEVIPAGVEQKEGLVVFPEVAIKKIKHEGGAEQELGGLKVGATNLEATFSAAYGARLEQGVVFGVTET
jgi:hypothetical protein